MQWNWIEWLWHCKILVQKGQIHSGVEAGIYIPGISARILTYIQCHFSLQSDIWKDIIHFLYRVNTNPIQDKMYNFFQLSFTILLSFYILKHMLKHVIYMLSDLLTHALSVMEFTLCWCIIMQCWKEFWSYKWTRYE